MKIKKSIKPISMFLYFWFIPCCLSLVTCHCYAQRLPETIIRVGILVGVKSFNLSCESKYYLYDLASGKRSYIKPMDDYLVRSARKGIVIDGKRFGPAVRLISEKSGSYLRAGGRRYRDNIIITSKNGKLTVVNELGLEDYLYGILPREVSPAWPMETLKAQAVVSRTYVLRNLRKHGKDGFDVCTKTHCQVYGGVESENKITNAAVEATRGEVLVYKGVLAQSLFHASCGGHTENPNYVWVWNNSCPKYLRGVRDRFCSKSPHSYWKKKISASTIKAKLLKAKYSIGNIRKITKHGKNRSGRPKTLRIKHSRGTLNISPAKFRMAISPWTIKSAFITSIVKKGNEYIFKGKGWGHGVGLCQWGAKGMGERGYKHKRMLRFYYPGTKVEKWEE